MSKVAHMDAIALEHQVRRLYKCDRLGISGLANSDEFEDQPILAAVLIVAYIYANHKETEHDKYQDFLEKYRAQFEGENGTVAADEYLADIRKIVDEFV